MVRAAAFLLLLSSLTVMAQKIGLDRRPLLQQTICGPISVQARMLDTSLRSAPRTPSKSWDRSEQPQITPIVLERTTAHFDSETPTSGAPFEMEHKVEIGGKQQAFSLKRFQVQIR